MVIGTCVALQQGPVTGLKKLPFADKKNLFDLSLAAIRSSKDIIRAHMDYG